MAEDPKLSQRYRELPREEPPRALDDAILAASRRAVAAHPAPLVAPTGRRRWYFPVAAAAVITLAVAVTLHIQRDHPGEEVDAVSPSMQVQETPPPAEAPKAAARQAEVPRRADESMLRAERAPQPFAAAPSADSAGALSGAPAAAPAPAPEPAAPPAARAEQRERNDAATSAGMRRSRDAPPPPPASAPAAKSLPGVSAGAIALQSSPEQWLQGIADLRRQGRHEEADKALAEFRKRYPDYRLTDEMRAKVEKK